MKLNIFTALLFCMLLATWSSCKKKCAECPDGMHLSVDDPKEKSCICCPSGQEYDAALGYCQ